MNVDTVDTVIGDLELEQRKAIFYYAVDAFDVSKYCFPTNREFPEIEEISDEQAAYDYVFRLRSIPPVLPREYSEELDANYHHMMSRVEDFSHAKVLKKLVDLTHQTKDQLFKDVANRKLKKEDIRDFNVALAICLGLYTLGVERFQWLHQRFDNPMGDDIQSVLRSIAADYAPSAVVDKIKACIINFRPQTVDRRRAEVSALRDALVIDRLLFMNNRLVQAYPDRLKFRHMVLYLSSAERTRHVFAMDEVKQRLPIIDGRTFSFHRTFEHPYTFLVFSAGNADEDIQRLESIERLKTIRDVLNLNTVNQFNRRWSARTRELCPVCIQESAGNEMQSEKCPFVLLCKAVQALEQLRKDQRRAMGNLGLLSKVQSYQNLDISSDQNVGELHLEGLYRFFVDTAGDAEVQDRALAKMLAIQKLMRAQMDFKDFTYYVHPTLSREDYERVPYQAHFFLPAVHGTPYDKLVSKLVAFESHETQEERFREYENIVREFLAMETKVTGIDPVHELVRGLLYLCSPTNTGDREANKHARMLWGEGKNISGTIRSELLFFAAWTNSCERSYRDAVDLADLGIKSYSNDARFPYVKARSILRDLEEGDKPEREERIAEAIKIQQLAVELAHKYHPSNAWLNGAMNNALAYYLCYTDWADDAHTTRIKLARLALRRLKEEIPKERWHSNFFHTEAAVELNEALITKSAAREYEIKAELQSYPNKRAEALALASQERKNACDKLSRALTEIDRALKNSQESRFIALRQRILVELEDLGFKSQN